MMVQRRKYGLLDWILLWVLLIQLILLELGIYFHTFLRHRKVSSRFKFRFTFDRLSLDIQDQFCPYLSFDRYSNSYLTFIRYSLYIQFTFVRHSSLVSTTICLSSGISFLTLPSLDIHYTFSSHSLDIQVWCQPLSVCH